MSSSQPDNNSLDPANGGDDTAANGNLRHGAGAADSSINQQNDTQPIPTNLNNNSQPLGASEPAASLPANTFASSQAPMPTANPARRPRWSQTTGTAIFSYNPITRQLVPIAGTPPVTTWSSINPLNGPLPSPPLPQAQGVAPATGIPVAAFTPGLPFDPPWNSPFESPFTEGTQVSTHLSFSTSDGRAIPLAIMRQFLSGLGGTTGGTGAPTLDQLMTRHAAGHQQPADAQGSQQSDGVNPTVAGPGDASAPDAATIGGHNLRPRQRTRASSVPAPISQTTADVTAANADAASTNATNPTANDDVPPGAPFDPGWAPFTMDRMLPFPGIQAMPGLPGMPHLPGMTFGPFPFPGMMGIPGLDMERPPDTRRAKELLRGLTIVPRGLVKRMERVEKMLGEESAESGKLVCAVCYDPLLGDLHIDEKADVIMKDRDEDEKLDAADPTKPKAKPKHPSLEPDALVALPCTHVFHAVDCLLPWFEQGKTTCPTCRFDIDPRSETLNLARWLGRRRRPASNSADGGPANTANTTQNPTDANPPNATADTRMEADDDDEDANVIEEESGSDSTTFFRDTIRRALLGALGQALFPPMSNEDQRPVNSNAPPSAADAAANAQTGLPTGQPDQWGSGTLTDLMLDVFGQDGALVGSRRGPTDTNIELPGANRDQDGRMLRGDGESSTAATANSTPHTATTELPPTAPVSDSEYPNTRGRRERAPSPSPGPQQTETPSTSTSRRSDWSRFTGFFSRGSASSTPQEQPAAGPSNSGHAVASGSSTPSRPATPRHHPYANARPPTNARSAPVPTGMGSIDVPRVDAGPNGATTLSFGSEVNNGNGRMSITRHSITFNLAVPLASLMNLRAPAAAETTGTPNTNANANTPQQQQQPTNPTIPVTPATPDFLNSMIFGLAPLGAAASVPDLGALPSVPTGAAGASRTERTRTPRKKWVAPEGTSLRSVIESKERQVGLRCDDVSCLWGPEDGDEEDAEVKIRPNRTCLRRAVADLAPSCVHRYHPECLLVASRIADAGLDREMDCGRADEWLEAACPFCRVHGGQEKCEWRMHRGLADSA